MKFLRLSIVSGCLLVLFVLDRVTKLWALRSCVNAWYINQYLSCELVFNRGISWSFFSFTDDLRFIVLSVVVVCATAVLSIHAWYQYRAGVLIVGELLVITGSLSNLIDRWMYGGVIDFIILSYKSFSWPVFNFADAYIVCGVYIMIMLLGKQKKL